METENRDPRANVLSIEMDKPAETNTAEELGEKFAESTSDAKSTTAKNDALMDNDDAKQDSSSEDIQILPTTPKRQTVASPATPATTSAKRRRLTKEEIEERERVKLEKKKEREELAEKKRIEKETLAKQREQKRLEEEEARKRREEEKERKRLELKAREEEKERKRREEEEARKRREEEKERKRLEMKAREEEKELKRLEERKLKEEELMLKRREEEEAEEKKRRQAEKFKNFFVKIDTPRTAQTLPAMQNSRFQPFEVKAGMRLAPIQVRNVLSGSDYDAFLRNGFECAESNYLAEVRCKKRKYPRKTKFVAVDENGVGLKVKLLQFFENIRPPYYGTWRKRSKIISGRRPLVQEELLNYEYDSDQDWEEEPSDAEECKSDDEEDPEKDDDDDEDDGFFVEHGYLSSDEGSGEDDETDTGDVAKKMKTEVPVDEKSRRRSETEDQRKHRLAQRAEEWKESQKMKAKRFKRSTACTATVFGPSWTDSEDEFVDGVIVMDVDESGDGKPPKSRRHILPPSLKAMRQMQAIVFDYSKLVPTLSESKENVPLQSASRTPKVKTLIKC